MRVLAVVAHPDDELLGPGGTLLRHLADGDSVHVHVECVAGLREWDTRHAAAMVASDGAGWGLTFGESPQLGHEPIDLDGLLADQRPDIVYTHHGGDLNRDHRLVSEAVIVATRPYAVPVRSVRLFETPSSTEWGAGFVPSLFVNVDPYLNDKLALLRHYASELRPWPHPRSEVAIRDRARYWGSVAGFRAAEPFAVHMERL